MNEEVEYGRLLEMYKLIILKKPQPPELTEAERAAWDRLVAQVEEIMREHPGAILDIPFDSGEQQTRPVDHDAAWRKHHMQNAASNSIYLPEFWEICNASRQSPRAWPAGIRSGGGGAVTKSNVSTPAPGSASRSTRGEPKSGA